MKLGMHTRLGLPSHLGANGHGGEPMFLTVPEVARLLRTTVKAIYLMVERRQLPGVTRVGRRVLLRCDVLLDWLSQESASSPKE